MSAAKSSEGVGVHNQGNSSEFLKNLKGFLGLQLEFLESEFCSKISRSSSTDALDQSPREKFRKKRSPTRRQIHDVSGFDEPFSAYELSAAEALLILKNQDIGLPQISWKEEDLANAVPQSSSPESHSSEEKAFKKPAVPSKIFPRKQKKRCHASSEGEMRAEKRAKKSLHPFLETADPDLPMDFKNRIRELTGSEEAVFILEKKLYNSDINPALNRLLIPCKKVKNDFLTEEEMQKLKTSDPLTGKCSIEALLIEPSLEKESKINLREWDMGGKVSGRVSENYVLVTSWKNVVKDNNLAEGITLQLWSFRRGEELCFALVNASIDRV